MKNFVLTTLILLAFDATINAQCSKIVTWTASKEEFIDSNQNVTSTNNEKVIVISSKNEIKLIHNDEEGDALVGTIKDFSCNWKDDFKNGETFIKADLTKKGNVFTLISFISIIAKDGKISILVAMDTPDGFLRIRIPVDSYKEVD